MRATAVLRIRSDGRERAGKATVATLLSILLVLVAGQARAEELSDIAGAFADVGIGADAMGMGGAVVASGNGAGALFWNPAGLAGTDHEREVTLSYCDQLGLVPYSAGAGSFRLGGYSVGVGLLYSGDDVLSETTLLVGAARELTVPWLGGTRVDVGATLKSRWASFGNNVSDGEQVTGSALGVGVDVGVVAPLNETTTLGLTCRDMLNVLNWDSSVSGSYGENVPPALVAGVAMRPSSALLMEIDLDKSLSSDTDDLVRAGLELELFEVASLRGGYRVALPDGEAEEFSLGAGASVETGGKTVTLDLGYLFGPLENTLRLTLGVGL